MGKGGEQSTKCSAPATGASGKTYKLEKLETEVLRKWAKQYALDVKEDTREALLKELNPYADGILDKNRPPNNFSLEKPPFTLADIKNAIPAHCFKRNFFTSMSHLISDFAIIAVLGYLATYIGNNSFLPEWSKYILWPIYWVAQGCMMTGVWVLAHECGHQSFSESEFANNVVGTICHSMLLVPYHSWRITHGLHHNNTGSCDNDEVFAPSTLADWGETPLRETPLATMWGIFVMLTVGWMPGYLVFNAAGPAKYRGKNNSHFSPTAVMFKPEEYWLIVQTDIAFFTCLGLLIYAIYTFGFLNVACYYLLPYMVVNHNLVLITYLQHTDVYMPHFRGEEWNWLRGALCTVDRPFGPVLDHVFHHITDTHVCHHIFSKMPFYHAHEATEAIKKVIGKYYFRDETRIPLALYRAYSCCQFVDADKTTVFFKNIK